MKNIINLTQHEASEEQKMAGVIDLPEDVKSKLRLLLTFEEIPTRDELETRAKQVSRLALENVVCFQCGQHGVTPNSTTGVGVECIHCGMDANPPKVMVGGAPFFMAVLESELKKNGFAPVYAFSKRECVEEKQDDGKILLRRVFKHLGFVEAFFNSGGN